MAVGRYSYLDVCCCDHPVGIAINAGGDHLCSTSNKANNIAGYMMLAGTVCDWYEHLFCHDFLVVLVVVFVIQFMPTPFLFISDSGRSATHKALNNNDIEKVTLVTHICIETSPCSFNFCGTLFHELPLLLFSDISGHPAMHRCDNGIIISI
jgi:hypothetical protein